MGPRPIGRGNSRPSPPPRLSASLQWGRDRSVAEIPPDPARTNPHKLLQWGRDRSVAEILGNSWGWTVDFRGFNGAATDRSRKLRYRNTRAKLVCFASMGPRPIGRGNLVGIGDHHDLLLASMGPRPIGRGNGQWRAGRPSTGHGFNGAATDRSRKCGRRVDGFVEFIDASMGPRPIGRGNSPSESDTHAPAPPLQWGGDRSVAEIRAAASIATSSVRLQWGRDRSVAEIPPAGDPCPRTVCASMGPRPIGRGNALVPCLLGPSGAGLQWGRDRSVAEIRKVQALRLRLDGLLQWGRDRSVAEMPLDFADVYHWLAASMGPRPIGRGNLRVRHSGPLAGGRFNGAATDRSRKSAPPTPPLATPNPASMGPRPIGRGNYFRPPAPGGGTPGFNGAATDRSRKFARARRAEQGRDASMGPRPIGRGNEPRCPTSSNGPPGFNGAATDRARKSIGATSASRRGRELQWGRDPSVAEM